jgi:hypothetical protein
LCISVSLSQAANGRFTAVNPAPSLTGSEPTAA